MGVIFSVTQCCSTCIDAVNIEVDGRRTDFFPWNLNAAKCQRLRTKRCMIVILCKRYEVTNGGGNYVKTASYPPPLKVDTLWQTRRMRLMTTIDVGMFSTFVVPAKVGVPVSPRDWSYRHNYVSVSVVFVFNRMIVWREIGDR